MYSLKKLFRFLLRHIPPSEKSHNISANTKAQRLLEDVKFTARLAGAIHVVEIAGSFTYENLINE